MSPTLPAAGRLSSSTSSRYASRPSRLRCVETAARILAETLASVLHVTDWSATVRIPRAAYEGVDHQDSVVIEIAAFNITVTRTVPRWRPISGERWVITINGAPIAHRPLPGEAVAGPIAITRSVLYYVHQWPIAPCDFPGCPLPATVATWASSRCPGHA